MPPKSGVQHRARPKPDEGRHQEAYVANRRGQVVEGGRPSEKPARRGQPRIRSAPFRGCGRERDSVESACTVAIIPSTIVEIDCTDSIANKISAAAGEARREGMAR